MEKKDPHQLLTRFNGLYKELDDVYHSLARHYGLSDCALWILYTIRQTTDQCTQSQLCELLSLSKQTINSALKSLEAAGHIRLMPVIGNQKSKQVLLTETGKRFAAQTTDNIMSIELKVFAHFSAEEQAMLFDLLETYVERLETEARTILNQPVLEGSDEGDNG